MVYVFSTSAMESSIPGDALQPGNVPQDVSRPSETEYHTQVAATLECLARLSIIVSRDVNSAHTLQPAF
jgi:hypothetical protein